MTSVVARLLWIFLWTILLAWPWAAAGQVQRLNVCAVGFNSPEELAAVRTQLPADEFKFIDLTAELLTAETVYWEELAASTDPGRTVIDPALTHTLGLCASGLRCDVWIYSGEFAGEFFGHYGSSLSLQTLEEAACQPQCRNLFHRAQEVFLLACNTLANKDPDSRTPDQYRQVLLDHGFDRAGAERVVQLRYGSCGPSFGQAFLRIFAGVPRVYGFSSVAPNGLETAARLERYFRKIGDYRRHLDSSMGSTAPNTDLLAAFRGTSLVQMTAGASSYAQAAEHDLVCRVYDDARNMGERVRIVHHLLARSDFLAFLPTVTGFLRRHPVESLEGEARRQFMALCDDALARDRVIDFTHTLNASALQLELANLALRLEWIGGDEFRHLAIDAARQLMVPPVSSEGVDALCEASERQPIGSQFRSEDLPDALFRDAHGLRLVACLSPPDQRISRRLAAGLESPDVWARRWAVFGLSRYVPLDPVVLEQLAPHLSDPSADVRERVRRVLNAQRASR